FGSPDTFILFIWIGDDVWSGYIRSGIFPIALHSFSLGRTCEQITGRAVAVNVPHVKTDYIVDFPTVYPAFHGVIDVVDQVIPGHGFTFLSADWGERGNCYFKLKIGFR